MVKPDNSTAYDLALLDQRIREQRQKVIRLAMAEDEPSPEFLRQRHVLHWLQHRRNHFDTLQQIKRSVLDAYYGRVQAD